MPQGRSVPRPGPCTLSQAYCLPLTLFCRSAVTPAPASHPCAQRPLRVTQSDPARFLTPAPASSTCGFRSLQVAALRLPLVCAETPTSCPTRRGCCWKSTARRCVRGLATAVPPGTNSCRLSRRSAPPIHGLCFGLHLQNDLTSQLLNLLLFLASLKRKVVPGLFCGS